MGVILTPLADLLGRGGGGGRRPQPITPEPIAVPGGGGRGTNNYRTSSRIQARNFQGSGPEKGQARFTYGQFVKKIITAGEFNISDTLPGNWNRNDTHFKACGKQGRDRQRTLFFDTGTGCGTRARDHRDWDI